MKNLKHYVETLDDPDLIIDLFDKYDYDRRYHYRSEYHDVGGINPYRRIKRILKEYLGKSFDEAFSKFCLKVPKYQQKIFLSYLKKKSDVANRYSSYWGEYLIDDDNKIIFVKERPRRKVVFYSHDYKEEKVNRITGVKYSDDWWFRVKNCKKKNIEKKYYVIKIISGFKKEFDSRHDREFKRLNAEKIKKQRRASREYFANKKEIEYSFLTKDEIELKKQKEIDKYKILKHGFDLKTSFRGNGVNPDVIKEEQGYG